MTINYYYYDVTIAQKIERHTVLPRGHMTNYWMGMCCSFVRISSWIANISGQMILNIMTTYSNPIGPVKSNTILCWLFAIIGQIGPSLYGKLCSRSSVRLDTYLNGLWRRDWPTFIDFPMESPLIWVAYFMLSPSGSNLLFENLCGTNWFNKHTRMMYWYTVYWFCVASSHPWKIF